MQSMQVLCHWTRVTQRSQEASSPALSTLMPLIDPYPDAATRARCKPLLFEAFVRYDQRFGQVDYLEIRRGRHLVEAGEVGRREARAQVGFDDLPDEVDLEFIEQVFAFVGPAIANVQHEPHWHFTPSCRRAGTSGRRLRRRRS